MCRLLKVKWLHQKTYYLFPFIDENLDKIVGHELYSFGDGYSGYNQIKITK